MKTFRCGDLVPGCQRVFTGEPEEILDQVAGHATQDHGMVEVGPELVAAVHGAMRPVP